MAHDFPKWMKQRHRESPKKCLGFVPSRETRVRASGPSILWIFRRDRETGFFSRYLSHSGFISKGLYDLDDYTFLMNFKDGSLALGIDALYVDCAVHDLYLRRGNQ